MTPALELASSSTGHDDRQIRVVVDVGIAHSAAKHVERVVEQRPIAVRRLVQLLDEIRKQRHVMGVDLGQLDQLFRIVGVMRDRVMRLGHPDVRVGSGARFTRHLERDDAGDIGLEGEHLEVEHQPDVVFPHRRHACRTIEIGQRCGIALFGALDASLDLAHGIEVLADANTIACTELAPQSSQIVRHPVEDAAALLELGASCLGASAIAEQPLENDARIGVGWKR